jgi:predicted dehydrogenase
LAEAAQSQLTAICDIRKEAARHLAERFRVGAVYSDLEQALSESGADAVYAATPVSTHVAIGLRTLAHAKHLLVEKPLGLDGAQALRLAEAAKASEKLSACAYYRRFTGQYRYTKAAIEKGDLGTPVGGVANYFLHLPSAHVLEGRWFLQKSVAGGGLLCHLGSHVFDILVGLFGLPATAMACCGAFHANLDVEDWAAVILRLPNGAPFNLNFNWNSNAPVRHDFEMLGSEGRIAWPAWPPHGDGPVIVRRGGTTHEQNVANSANFHLPLVQDFVAAVLNHTAPMCPLTEAAKTNLILDAIYRSASEGREVAIAKEENGSTRA